MDNKIYIVLGVVLFIGIGIFLYFQANPFSVSGNVVSDNTVGNNVDSKNVQSVVLSFKNGNYYPNSVSVKEDVPVRISLDNSVKGCYRSFTLREFGVAKYLGTSSDYVVFTPDKKGTFMFACSMGMGTGKLIVE